jgi:hypothetical protein
MKNQIIRAHEVIGAARDAMLQFTLLVDSLVPGITKEDKQRIYDARLAIATFNKLEESYRSEISANS